jgi:hypothetical protein
VRVISSCCSLAQANVLHFDSQAGSSGQGPIRGEERRLIQLGHGHVEGIIGADVVPVLPGFSQETRVGNAVDRPGAEILERQPRTVLLDPLLQQGTPQHRQHLDIQQGRSKQVGVLGEEVIELLAEGSAPG